MPAIGTWAHVALVCYRPWLFYYVNGAMVGVYGFATNAPMWVNNNILSIGASKAGRLA